MKAAFGWVGGKSKFAAQIIERIPPHTLYCEVFAGGLSVLYAKEPSKIEVINDLNGELINLHLQIKTRPESLSNYLRSMIVSREIFYAIKKGSYPVSNDIERAAAYLYRLTLSYGALGCTFLMPKRKRPKSLWRDFAVCSRRLKGVCIERLDFGRLLREYDGRESFFYLDPPYYRNEHYYEGGHFNGPDHERLRDCLAAVSGRWLLSYNDCAEIREMYKGYRAETIAARYSFGEKRGVHSELVISNY
ncbi:MAG: DNA adenine methylase [Helicobacteraceae bacterium]|jgi:DNA adenine methylase|nr:DNA adenine methylase [Helicobacteraceae bacterium]